MCKIVSIKQATGPLSRENSMWVFSQKLKQGVAPTTLICPHPKNTPPPQKKERRREACSTIHDLGSMLETRHAQRIPDSSRTASSEPFRQISDRWNPLITGPENLDFTAALNLGFPPRSHGARTSQGFWALEQAPANFFPKLCAI